MRSRRVKTWTSVGQLITGVASLVFVFFQYLKGGATNDPLLLAVFFLFATTIFIDRIGQIFTTYSTEQEEDDLHNLIDRLPGNLIGHTDIISFPNDHDASVYCTAMLPFAVNVKNTLLRYNQHERDASDNTDYTEWFDVKVKSIESGDCSWTEIISSNIDRDAYYNDIIRHFSKAGRSKYSFRYIDENKTPMIQMALLELKNGAKEIIFGWQFPGVPHGPCFLSKNERLITYFENYFMFYFEQICTTDRKMISAAHRVREG